MGVSKGVKCHFAPPKLDIHKQISQGLNLRRDVFEEFKRKRNERLNKTTPAKGG